jgi:alpha-beta hydrolase superfamily lysophospholipase
VLLHGIPSTVPPEPGDTGYPGLARGFAARGWAAVWVRMRAAGGAPGYFSIRGWVADARAAVETARGVVGGRGPVALVGASAGGAVAVQAHAEGAPVDALVLLGTPAEWVSLAATAREGLRRISESGMTVAPGVASDPEPWAAEFGTVTPVQSIAAASVPTLIVHGSDDEVVPVAHAHRLAAHGANADLMILEGAAHQLRRRPEVFALVVEWLGRVLG